jgi:hypothetical protein
MLDLYLELQPEAGAISPRDATTARDLGKLRAAAAVRGGADAGGPAAVAAADAAMNARLRDMRVEDVLVVRRGAARSVAPRRERTRKLGRVRRRGATACAAAARAHTAAPRART